MKKPRKTTLLISYGRLWLRYRDFSARQYDLAIRRAVCQRVKAPLG
ncbi:MAG: hypothetical protein GWP08_11540 [Nitrospiraceae bacterium]|nr:hypothetical protein [Nitrospiraceae bacterium]